MRYIQVLSSCLLAFSIVAGLAACGNDAKKTQAQVDVANSDLERMGKIDTELRTQGIYVALPERARTRLAMMSPEQLSAIDALLAEFIGRGHNVVNTARMRDVVYSEQQTQTVATWVRSAERIRSGIQARREGRDSDPGDHHGSLPRDADHGRGHEHDHDGDRDRDRDHDHGSDRDHDHNHDGDGRDHSRNDGRNDGRNWHDSGDTDCRSPLGTDRSDRRPRCH